MGEKARMPGHKSQAEEDGNSGNQNMDISDDDGGPSDLEDELSTEEFEALNKQLDDLSSALDDIESKNDNIHAQLLELLEANRIIREQIREANLLSDADTHQQ